MVEPKKKVEPGSPADGVTANGPEVSPADPRGFQPGQAVSGAISTNPPRGVGELPSDALADEPGGAAVQKAVQERIDQEEALGFRGDAAKNRTPNSAYTLQGVGRGDPTPETTVHTPSGK